MAYAPYTQLLQTLMHDKKFDQLTKAASLLHPDRDALCVMEYDGSDVRLFKRDDQVCIMCPYTMDYIQENAIARSIETGDIFEDADDVDRHAEFLQRTMLPCDAMANKNCAQPKKMKIIISGVIGRMNQDGSCELSQTDMDNGAEFIKDILNCKPGKVEDTCDAHLGMHQYEHELGHAHGPMHFKHDSLPLDIRKDIHDLTKEIDEISDDEDLSEYELDDSDFEPLQFDDKDDHDEYDDNEDDDKEHDDDDENEDDEDDENVQESVQLMQQPKRLKAIGREIISYIPTEIMQVQDTHDQMVLVGYLSSKLERVDFYLNCLDTDNGRYIVPHDRQYLLNMQRELTDLLQRVLRLKPVTKYERIWKPSMGV